MGGKSLLDRNDLLVLLVKTIRGEGLTNLSQDYFAAARQQTVTKFVSSRGVPAVQLEISATCLDPGRDPLSGHRFAQLLQALARFIEATASQKKASPRRHRGPRGTQRRLFAFSVLSLCPLCLCGEEP